MKKKEKEKRLTVNLYYPVQYDVDEECESTYLYTIQHSGLMMASIVQWHV